MATLLLPTRGRFPDLSLAFISILSFWLFYLMTVLVRGSIIDGGAHELLPRRLLGILLGILLTLLIYAALRLFGRGSLKRMIVIAAVGCLPASILFAGINFALFILHPPLVIREHVETTPDGTVVVRSGAGQVKVQRPGSAPLIFQSDSYHDMLMKQAPRDIADAAVTWYFFFAAWSSFYVAMSSANQLRLAERRAAEFERAAQSAQLRALRYQVNPHFLFNTLNSLSSLIMARREEEAEAMVMNLSHFFRSTLATDPTADVTLAEEIAMQRLYLDIERARFPNRLKVEVSIPEEIQSARIPALLLQPIVENAIKYGVARTRDVVTLEIKARESDGYIHLCIDNDGPIPRPGESGGTGVGLANVRQRLEARFGREASLSCTERPHGGYRVEIVMPRVVNG